MSTIPFTAGILSNGVIRSWISRHKKSLILLPVVLFVVLLSARPPSFLSTFRASDYSSQSLFSSSFQSTGKENLSSTSRNQQITSEESSVLPGTVDDFKHLDQNFDPYWERPTHSPSAEFSLSTSGPAHSPSIEKQTRRDDAPNTEIFNDHWNNSIDQEWQEDTHKLGESPAPSPEVQFKIDDTSSTEIVEDGNLIVEANVVDDESRDDTAQKILGQSPAPSPSTGEQSKSDDTSNTEVLEDGNLVVETNLVDAESPTAAEQEDGDSEEEIGENFIIPHLSYQVGTGNQLMEYKSAAVIARTLNRTLCLVPFFVGPPRHFGHLGDKNSGLYLEDRYDTDVLARFVKIASLDECVRKCNKRIDVHWRLKISRPPKWDKWFNETPRVSVSFQGMAKKWASTADIAASMGPRNDGPKCAGLSGLFPGLRWRGVFFATSAYLQHSKPVMRAADLLKVRAFGSLHSEPYLSVHWRFEESNCRGHSKGLCFTRCSNGRVIANARPSQWWEKMTIEGPKLWTKNGFNAVFVNTSDISGAVYDRAISHGLRTVYLATDGWISSRGPLSKEIVKRVVDDLRSRGLTVAGLWQITGLHNFADGASIDHDTLRGFFGMEEKETVSDHMVAVLEQEMCASSAVFLGSGQSTWSMAVADTRRGRRRRAELQRAMTASSDGPVDASTLEQTVIDEILASQFTAGPTCRGSYHPIEQTEEDEAPDGWLDYAACEERLDQGIGQCTRIRT